MANKKRTFIVMKSGKELEVISENNRYWICGETQFSKSNPNIVNVRKETVKESEPKKKSEKKKEVAEEEYAGEFDDTPDVSDILEEKVEV